MTAVVEPLATSDVETLCSLAREIWRSHYPPIIGEAQTEYMLAQRYDAAVVRAELESGDIWWDVVREDGTIAAFASSMRTADGELKLDKLYVHPSRQRRGLGAMLIEHAMRRARDLRLAGVVLAVNKHNASATAAYRKHGFEVREAVVKDIGGGFVMDDYVMFKSATGGA